MDASDLKRALFSDAILDIKDEAATFLRSIIHRFGKREEPAYIMVRVYPAIGPGIGIGWTREEKVDAALGKAWQQV